MTTVIDRDHIRESLAAAAHLEQFDVFARIDSTNSYLKDQPAPAPGKFHVAIADHQTAGRGRQNRKWVSAPGKSLCLSIAYTFADASNDITALTLALGVAVVEVLDGMGVGDVALKWPNDIVIDTRKLGGILAEAKHRGEGVTVVIGLGINMSPPVAPGSAVTSAWAADAIDLESVLAEAPTRAELSERMIDALFSACRQFGAEGFGAFAARFARFDALAGRTVVVDTPDGGIEGEVTGVGDDGALQVTTRSGPRRIISGTIREIRSDRPEQ